MLAKMLPQLCLLEEADLSVSGVVFAECWEDECRTFICSGGVTEVKLASR